MNMNTIELTVSASELSRPRVAAAGPVLEDSERQPCEVWTRVMGYHRPVASFNTGKKAEHAERRFFHTGK
jgi:hypothetical protein